MMRSQSAAAPELKRSESDSESLAPPSPIDLTLTKGAPVPTGCVASSEGAKSSTIVYQSDTHGTRLCFSCDRRPI